MQAYSETRETFSDVLIEPAYSDILHRGKVDTASWLGRLHLDLPIFSANMRHITEAKMCKAMSEWGAAGIIHRFMTVEQAVKEYEAAKKMCGKKAVIGVSLGVNEKDKERFSALREAGASLFCIDVAHGHHILVKKMLQWIRKETDCDKCKAPILIAGNIATWEAAMDLYGWGADIVKIGIGPGCFVPGTTVITRDGTKKIEDIQSGDWVLTHFGRYKPVIGVSSRPELKTVFKINNEESTGNHEYYVLHKKYRDIVTDDNIDEYATWVKAEDLTENYLLLQCS